MTDYCKSLINKFEKMATNSVGIRENQYEDMGLHSNKKYAIFSINPEKYIIFKNINCTFENSWNKNIVAGVKKSFSDHWKTEIMCSKFVFR
jgi:hypothetical protein